MISADDSGFIRIAIPAKFVWLPGQNYFPRFTSFGMMSALSSHPFTICSSPSMLPNELPELVFYIQPESGSTRILHVYALQNSGSFYGGIAPHKYQYAGHILLIAGGSGAGWCLPFIERFLRDDAYSISSMCFDKTTYRSLVKSTFCIA
jgi:hypothetical protein